MRLRSVFSAMVIGSLTVSSAALAADTYKIDPVHSAVIYQIKHFNVGNAYGRFNEPTGSVSVDNGAPAAFTANSRGASRSVTTLLVPQRGHATDIGARLRPGST